LSSVITVYQLPVDFITIPFNVAFPLNHSNANKLYNKIRLHYIPWRKITAFQAYTDRSKEILTYAQFLNFRNQSQ